MPWNVPDEYEQYLNFVTGNVVVMGRRTYEIFGKDLSAETSRVVITRSQSIDGAVVAHSLVDGIKAARNLGGTVFIAGGGSIYQQAVPLVDEMYLSTIKGDFDGDTFFPEFSRDQWTVIEERDEPAYVFRKYRRLRSVE